MSDIILAPAGVFTTDLRAFHGHASIKATYVARVQAHRDADEIVKGVYWQNGKGCGIGCTIHGSSHAAYETELGISRILARLEDGIFEGLPNEEAKAFPLQFLEAIPVGADLSQVWPTFCIWLLSDPTHGVRQYCTTDHLRTALDRIVTLYQNGANEKIEYRAAAYAADDAAAYAAAAAAYAYAADAAAAAAAAAAYAYAADAAAADAAAAATYAAADAAATYADDAADDAAAAQRKHRLAQRDMLLKILAAAPIPAHATNI